MCIVRSQLRSLESTKMITKIQRLSHLSLLLNQMNLLKGWISESVQGKALL